MTLYSIHVHCPFCQYPSTHAHMSHRILSTMDIFPTLLNLAGVALPDRYACIWTHFLSLSFSLFLSFTRICTCLSGSDTHSNLAFVPMCICVVCDRFREYDGKDISRVLFGITTESPHEYMFHYCGLNVSAARHGTVHQNICLMPCVRLRVYVCLRAIRLNRDSVDVPRITQVILRYIIQLRTGHLPTCIILFLLAQNVVRSKCHRYH